ncbi:2Fe-2S iron-sulfur cluster-binding protein [Ensifer canadensis]
MRIEGTSEIETNMTEAAHKDPLVLFMPSGKRGRFPVGTPVLDAARSLGVYVESVCGGRATCGRCQIEVQEGNFAKHKIVSSNDHISPVGPKEQRYASVRELPDGRRLSCSAQNSRRSRHRRAAGYRHQRPGGAQGRKRPGDRAQRRHPALLCRGR